MKVMKIAILAFFLAFFAGCTEQPQIVQNISDPHVVIENSKLYDWLQFDTINYVKRDDGLIEVEARFRNFSDYNQLVAYKIDWMDANGFVQKSLLSKWTITQVEERRNLVIHGIAPSMKIQDFKIRLQKPTADDNLRKDSYHREYQGN